MADAGVVKVLMRAAASAAVGAGHLRRCMALAQRLTALGARVEFALPSAEPPFLGWIRDAGFALREIGTVTDPIEDAVRCFETGSPEWAVVDDYRLDARWHCEAAARGVAVAVIDDLADRALRADILIDPNEHDDHRRKYAGVLSDAALLLGGCRFALLDAAYEAAPKYTFEPEVASIGIFMGGADAADASSLAFRACRLAFSGHIEVVATSAHPHLAALVELVGRDVDAGLVVDASDLSAFFARHDLHIGAGGGATWERCCIGVPTLAVPVANNQQQVLPELARRGVIAATPPLPIDIDSLSAAIKAVIGDASARERMADASRLLVDGRGALRVALAMMRDRIEVRPATHADCDRVLAWRNDPVVRDQSLRSEPIDPEHHRRWFANALSSGSRLMLIGHVADVPIGVVRFDRIEPADARVSIYLDPGLQGLGLGPVLLSQGELALETAGVGVRRIVCDVLPGNVASARMFRSAGYDGALPRLSKRFH